MSGPEFHRISPAKMTDRRAAPDRKTQRENGCTVAAITGQLAGALYGASGIPTHWLAKLAWRERLTAAADALAEAGAAR